MLGARLLRRIDGHDKPHVVACAAQQGEAGERAVEAGLGDEGQALRERVGAGEGLFDVARRRGVDVASGERVEQRG